MRKTHWKHFVWIDWRIRQGQLHYLLDGMQNEKVLRALCKRPGVRGMFFLSSCGLFQPVLFSICCFISYSLRCGDTCWVGGVLHGLPGPRPATWCLGHMCSPDTPRPTVMEGGRFLSGRWRAHPRKAKRKWEMGLHQLGPWTPVYARWTSLTKWKVNKNSIQWLQSIKP